MLSWRAAAREGAAAASPNRGQAPPAGVLRRLSFGARWGDGAARLRSRRGRQGVTPTHQVARWCRSLRALGLRSVHALRACPPSNNRGFLRACHPDSSTLPCIPFSVGALGVAGPPGLHGWRLFVASQAMHCLCVAFDPHPPPTPASPPFRTHAAQQVYWVDLDYLEVAQAAARCGAHFTALLYAEAWQEARHGWLVPLAASSDVSKASVSGRRDGGEAAGEGSGAGAGWTAALEQLLLDIYSSINEPDGIYAVARSHSMLSQVRCAGCTVAPWASVRRWRLAGVQLARQVPVDTALASLASCAGRPVRLGRAPLAHTSACVAPSRHAA